MMIFNKKVAILCVQFVILALCKFLYFSFYARVDSISFLFLPVEIISRSYTKSI